MSNMLSHKTKFMELILYDVTQLDEKSSKKQILSICLKWNDNNKLNHTEPMVYKL
jgi:hypothetical protein